MTAVLEGIIVGAAGGAIAGLTVWAASYLHERVLERRHRNRIYQWLVENTSREKEPFKSTRTIASWTHLTEDRVRYICSVDKRVFRILDGSSEMWSVYIRERPSVYEKRGMISV